MMGLGDGSNSMSFFGSKMGTQFFLGLIEDCQILIVGKQLCKIPVLQEGHPRIDKYVVYISMK
jgi:cation transporter-like permease